MDIMVAARISQNVFNIAAFKVGTSTRRIMATEAHRPRRGGDPLGDRIESLLILPEDRFPFVVAFIVLIQIATITACVTHEAIDVFQLRLAYRFARQ